MTVWLRLAKTPLSLLIGFASFFGGILASSVISYDGILLSFGIFIVAAGAASLNSLQDQRIDGAMLRTKNRPLPAGLILPWQAGLLSLSLLLVGMVVVVLSAGSVLAVALTVIAVIVYNGVYTPLKKRTVLAIFPGALCGGLPVYIGWLAGGGEWVSFPAALLVAMFFLWQMPHFWLVVLAHQTDYGAGSLPNMLNQFQEKTLKRFLMIWICSLCTVLLMFATLPYSLSTGIRTLIMANALLFSATVCYVLLQCEVVNYRILFLALNSMLSLHMVILGVGRILG